MPRLLLLNLTRYDIGPQRGEPMNNVKLGIALIAAAVALAGCGEQKPPVKAEQTKIAPAAAGIEVRIGHVGRSPAASPILARTTRTARASRSRRRTQPGSRSTARKGSS